MYKVMIVCLVNEPREEVAEMWANQVLEELEQGPGIVGEMVQLMPVPANVYRATAQAKGAPHALDFLDTEKARRIIEDAGNRSSRGPDVTLVVTAEEYSRDMADEAERLLSP